MAKSQTSLIWLGVLMLSACGEMSPSEQAQMDALLACSERASAAFPVLADMTSIADEKSTEDFRVDPTGAFVWSAAVKGEGRPLSDNFTCHGNLNERAVEFVEFNGVKRRPQSQEVWKF